MYIRVAEAIASVEKTPELQKKWATKFYTLMAENKFLPNSPCLMNAGRRLGMLSACFVLPVEDDLDQIFSSVKATALVQRAGGGTGFNFSNLRPNGSIVKSSGGTTAGPLSFIDVFSQATSTIQQGAFRRGANMGIMSIDHPDVIDFINAKKNLNRWQNYNVSIAMTDAWMKTLGDNPHEQHVVTHKAWGTGKLWQANGVIKAFKNSEAPQFRSDAPWEAWTYKDTWNLICERAHATGEPGLFFIDTANKNNPIAHYGRIEATNPCGEQPLHAYDSCNLGSINLSKYYAKVIAFAGKLEPMDPYKNILWKELADDITTAVRFLDNVIDANNYPIVNIETVSKCTRRIGLGVMGFADLLYALEIPYNSMQGCRVGEHLAQHLNLNADRASMELGAEKGIAPSLASTKLQYRNAFRTTVAPTGTISIIANCSGGIEPLFALAFKRTVMPDANGKFKEMYEENSEWKIAVEGLSTLRDHAIKHGSISNYNAISDREKQLKKIFVTSHDIAPEHHVNMQIAWQKYIDTAISKTINLPHDAPLAEVSKVYRQAWIGECKGITVYRDGCRDNVAGMKQPMSVDGPTRMQDTLNVTDSTITNKKEEDIVAKLKSIPKQVQSRPVSVYPARRTQIKTQFGNLHVCVVLDETGTKEREIFAQLGKAGDLIAADIEAICRLASLALRSGVTLEAVIDQLRDIGTTHITMSEHGKIVSMPDALAKALQKYVTDRDITTRATQNGSSENAGARVSVSGSDKDSNSKHGNAKTSTGVADRTGKGIPTEGRDNETSNIQGSSERNGEATREARGKDRTESHYGIKCPACRIGNLAFQEGCRKCHACGYSAC